MVESERTYPEDDAAYDGDVFLMSAEDKVSILRDEAGEESMQEAGVELGADRRRKPGQHKYLFLFMSFFSDPFSNYTCVLMTHNTPGKIRLFEVLELFRGEGNIHRSCETSDVGILDLPQGVHVPIRSLRFFTELVPTTGAAEAVAGHHIINSILLFTDTYDPL